jgi:phosphate transport system protein
MSSVHTMRDFDTELREVRSRAREMGTRCERAVAIAIEALLRGPSDLAGKVRELEEETDRDDVDITARALRILALRQPVARDLRFVTATLKLVTDLERIGDEAVLVADRATEGRGETKSLVLDDLEPMAKQAQEALRDALRGFFDEDIDGAQRALESDRAVNEQYSAIIATTSDRISKRGEDAESGMLVVRIAKHLERIAGHAANVAEEAIFVVGGIDVRHARSVARTRS